MWKCRIFWTVYFYVAQMHVAHWAHLFDIIHCIVMLLRLLNLIFFEIDCWQVIWVLFMRRIKHSSLLNEWHFNFDSRIFFVENVNEQFPLQIFVNKPFSINDLAENWGFPRWWEIIFPFHIELQSDFRHEICYAVISIT